LKGVDFYTRNYLCRIIVERNGMTWVETVRLTTKI
jgi:hypothetical protein